MFSYLYLGTKESWLFSWSFSYSWTRWSQNIHCPLF